MIFWNIPDIFNFPASIIEGHAPRHESRIVRDYRNSVLLAPLEESLSNLTDIRDRIQSRIEKEIASSSETGVNMASSTELFNAAQDSLAYAIQAVGIATSTISGTDPHPAYQETQDAYVALNQARTALDTVVDSISSAVDQASSTPHLVIKNAKNRK